MLAAMRQCLGLLLQEAQFLQVMRRQADQVALAGDGDLKRLPDPPGGVGGKARAVADVVCLPLVSSGWLSQAGKPDLQPCA